MKRLLVTLLFCVCIRQKIMLAAPVDTPSMALVISDADEVRVGKVLAKKFAEGEGIAPSPQNKKLDAYLQQVGDKVAVYTKRKLPYKFHFDPNPNFRSAVVCRAVRCLSAREFLRIWIPRISWRWCWAMRLSMSI